MRYVIVRLDHGIYLGTESWGQELFDVADALGTRVKKGRFVKLCEVDGSSRYADLELLGHLEMMVDPSRCRKLSNRKLVEYIRLSEEEKKRFAAALFKKQRYLKKINCCLIALVVLLALIFLLID